MEMEIEKEKETNPDIFLDEDDLKEKEDNLSKSESIELNEITIKENDYLIIGCYGNGSAFIKTVFFKEIKEQKQSFKIKFMSKGKDINKKKILFSELYQINSNGKNILILLTKFGILIENEKYLLNYFKESNIKYKEIICFDSLTINNFYSEKKIEQCYYIKNSKEGKNESNCNKLPIPNTLSGFCADILCKSEFENIPCIVFISVFGQYDIGFDSISIFENAVNKYDFLCGKINKEYFEKNNIDRNIVKSVFNEFNSTKKSYFS